LARFNWFSYPTDVVAPVDAHVARTREGLPERGPVSPPRTPPRRGDEGSSLVEVMVATGLLATSLVTLAQLFGMATRSNIASRSTTYAAVLAQQKVEELRALTWGFDPAGLPISDTTSNIAVNPEQPNGGSGLRPSPSTALNENTQGYVDYVDQFGNKVGTGGTTPPTGAIYTRRWSIQPLPTNPNNTLVLQVLVTRNFARAAADQGAVARLPEEARLVTVKTRKSQ
jgi:type II secretory pathway pseudopilin PulG